MIQRIQMAIQRGNATCVLGTVPASETFDKVFDFVEHSENIHLRVHIFIALAHEGKKPFKQNICDAKFLIMKLFDRFVL